MRGHGIGESHEPDVQVRVNGIACADVGWASVNCSLPREHLGLSFRLPNLVDAVAVSITVAGQESASVSYRLSRPPCPRGQGYNGVAPSSCSGCPRGKFARPNSVAACQPCDAGSFANVSSSGQCSRCPSGKVSVPGAPSCHSCAAGSAPSAQQDQCVPCSKGKVSRGGRAACEPCEPGEIPVGQGTSCARCPVGSYRASNNHTCVECDPGENAEAAWKSCAACPRWTCTQHAGGASPRPDRATGKRSPRQR